MPHPDGSDALISGNGIAQPHAGVVALRGTASAAVGCKAVSACVIQ